MCLRLACFTYLLSFFLRSFAWAPTTYTLDAASYMGIGLRVACCNGVAEVETIFLLASHFPLSVDIMMLIQRTEPVVYDRLWQPSRRTGEERGRATHIGVVADIK